MSIPTVADCRNLICGTAAQLDVTRYRGTQVIERGALLSQPDPDAAWPDTIAATVDSLLFEGRAYWLVLATDGVATEQNPAGLPVRARPVPASVVEPIVNTDVGAYARIDGYRMYGTELPPQAVIAFDAGHEGVLAYGARTLVTALQLERAARRFANVRLPAGTLTNTAHEVSEAEAKKIVAGFEAAREESGIAFLQGVAYKRESLSAVDLQLVEARAQAATECARLFSVPVALVGASPTGNASALLYSNLASMQASLLTQAVGPVLRCIESVLSGPAVTPRGQRVSFNAGQWLRADPVAAADWVVKLFDAGLVSADEGRLFLGLPPASGPAPADLTPGSV